jgi:quercetin dioxygenase-like cupin family protein
MRFMNAILNKSCAWRERDRSIPMTRINLSTIFKKERIVRIATICAVTLALAGLVSAQQPTFKRTILHQGDISVPGHEAVTALIEFQPAGSSGFHTHPGEEAGYVLEGTVLLEQKGQPDMTLNAGQAFLIPAGTVHSATSKGSKGARIVSTYIVEKGKPLATPVPGK